MRIKNDVGHQKVIAFGISGDGIFRYKGRLCFPDDNRLRKNILAEAHRSYDAIHSISTKMYYDLKEFYWWNNMK